MTKLQEHDAMKCRACGNEERASEGYPCVDCGTFICVICNLKGVIRCRDCEAKHTALGDGRAGGGRAGTQGAGPPA